VRLFYCLYGLRYAAPMRPTSNPAPGDLFAAVIAAPWGALGIRRDGGVLRELVYLPPAFKLKPPADELTAGVARQIEAYLSDPDFQFRLDLPMVGTLFQRKVWDVINSIPRGSVLTYGEVAKLIRSAPRAVGQACGANWYPLAIPCHRVIASGGIGGFSNHDEADGFHLTVKRWLLKHEGVPGF
jgi:methylated-DNA-[protein]-cysteine S-methyltransferase